MNRILIGCVLTVCLWMQARGQEQKEIVFQVDVRNMPFHLKDSTLSIGLRGSQPPLSWATGIVMSDANSDGIYEVPVIFETAETEELYFKFVLNDLEWESGDARKIEMPPSGQDTVVGTFRYEPHAPNPFKKFVGTWTLKDNTWEQSADGQDMEVLHIPNHLTYCEELNTKKSLLWKVRAPSATGHALWTYDETSGTVHHLSSFYPTRIGVGEGTVDPEGNLLLTIRFSEEPEGTYRRYSYTWINENEYRLESVQYHSSGSATGHYYGGTFIKIND